MENSTSVPPTPRGAAIPVRAMVLFPYVLPEDDADRSKVVTVLGNVVQVIQESVKTGRGLHSSAKPPVMVLNRVTQRNRYFRSAMEMLGIDADKWKFIYSWSVDTCQDWLVGWGKIIDDWYKDGHKEREGILQIPGDLRDVGDPNNPDALGEFLGNLQNMANAIGANDSDFVIGGYELIRRGGKFLIDAYGTLPLLYNWFPEVASQIRHKRITRPRSEFLAGRVEFFDKMLVTHRRFAYEQTTAFLINALSMTGATDQVQSPDICEIFLGKIQDHTGDRGFREAVDQLERMERMMRLLWRASHGGNMFDIDEYSVLDGRSAAIRSAAMVTFRNFLQPTKV